MVGAKGGAKEWGVSGVLDCGDITLPISWAEVSTFFSDVNPQPNPQPPNTPLPSPVLPTIGWRDASATDSQKVAPQQHQPQNKPPQGPPQGPPPGKGIE
ncbi:unnamed protein product, partial [Discosporangium mesarthrocarpum]